MNAREIAFIALFKALKEENFIKNTLDTWQKDFQPSSTDFHLAKEIAYGSMQRKLSLDHLAKQMAPRQKLSLKVKEKALIYTALYQLYFLHHPAYAIVDETIKIAKKHFHSRFSNFLNAFLRSFAKDDLALPTGLDAVSLSAAHSFPVYFIEELQKTYSSQQVTALLETSNRPGQPHMRVRNSSAVLPSMTPLLDDPLVVAIENFADLSRLAQLEDYYIQNVTPVALFSHLKKASQLNPYKILDLCASPGGKTLLLADAFPEAELTANDLTEDKLKKLRINIEKYGLNVGLSCQDGCHLKSLEKFDLILIDAPCSNTGVLNKRPEARWRLSKEKDQENVAKQQRLIQNAAEFLLPGGQIWYLTCSILKSENEGLVQHLTSQLPLKLLAQKTILPTSDGADGGFGAILSLN